MINNASILPSTRSGFSLVEVLLALAISAATAAVVVPEMMAWRDRGQTQNVARALQSLLQEVRQHALEEGRAWEFRISTETEWSFAPVGDLRRARSGTSADLSSSTRQTLSGQLPAGFRATMIHEGDPGSWAPSHAISRDSIRFLPDGTATAAQIVVHSRDGTSCRIEIERLTGICRIVTEETR